MMHRTIRVSRQIHGFQSSHHSRFCQRHFPAGYHGIRMSSQNTYPSDDSWKHRVPYRQRDDFKAIYSAQCHCGLVKYELSRDKPLTCKQCHCVDCRRLHGAPYQWAAVFHKEDVNFLDGYKNLEWYDTPSKTMTHKLPCKVRCAHCHSPILDEGRNMILVFPGLVNLETDEQKEKWKPSCHIFYSQRYIDVLDGLPKWTGLDGESDLIADSPAELVRSYYENRGSEKNSESKSENGAKRVKRDS